MQKPGNAQSTNEAGQGWLQAHVDVFLGVIPPLLAWLFDTYWGNRLGMAWRLITDSLILGGGYYLFVRASISLKHNRKSMSGVSWQQILFGGVTAIALLATLSAISFYGELVHHRSVNSQVHAPILAIGHEITECQLLLTQQAQEKSELLATILALVTENADLHTQSEGAMATPVP